MGILDFFRAKAPRSLRGAAIKAVDDDLFDDEFQRKLDYLAVVSKRVFSGAMRAERRTKKTGSGVEFADHRDYTAGDDIRAVALPALRHRVLLNFEGEAEGVKTDDVLRAILKSLPETAK